MKFTKFRQLRQAIAQLDTNLVASRIAELEEHLHKDGLSFDPQNTAITEEGIYYIEPDSGMATKVVAYMPDFEVTLTRAQRRALSPEGYEDRGTISRFHPYHILRCNTLTKDAKLGTLKNYTITKRLSGKFPFRIVKTPDPMAKVKKKEIYMKFDSQELYICEFCLMKACVLIEGMRGIQREDFDMASFFNVDFTHSWNSRGRLAKDHGFMNDLYPKDWEDICAIRKEQVQHHCEECNIDLSDSNMQKYLQVVSTDHVRDRTGYVRLICLCLGCLGDRMSYEHLRSMPEMQQFQKELQRQNRMDTVLTAKNSSKAEEPAPAKEFASQFSDAGADFGITRMQDD